MGKAKKRSIKLGKHNQMQSIKREEAIDLVVASFKSKNRTPNEEVFDLISLFGLNAEELLEAGALFEDVKGIEGYLND